MTTVIGFHGTDKVFDKFSTDVEKRSAGTAGGFWFSDCPYVAHTYTNHAGYNEKAYLKALEKGDIFGESIGNSSIIKVKISFSNPLIFDANGNKSGDLTGLRETNKHEVCQGLIKCFTIADLFNQAIKNGHDGVIVYNVEDIGGSSGYLWDEKGNLLSTIYGVKSESQIF